MPDPAQVVDDSTEAPRGGDRARAARLIHDGLVLVSSKWTVDVLLALGDGQRRYHELLAELHPISEKVLTQTLRGMERDGLIGRHTGPGMSARVGYSLTPLGATMAMPLKALGSWALHHGEKVADARARFDERAEAARAARPRSVASAA